MTRFVKPLLVVSCCLFFSAFLLAVYYNSVGSYVDENGWLIEDFWALGLASFAVILGLFGIFLSVVLVVVHKIRKRKVT